MTSLSLSRVIVSPRVTLVTIPTMVPVGLNVFGLRHYNARLYPDPGEILVVNLRLTHRNRRNGDKAQDIPRFVNDVSLHTPEVYNCKLVASNLLHLLCSKAKLRPETTRTFRCVCWDAASGVQHQHTDLKTFVSKAVRDFANGLRYVPSAGDMPIATISGIPVSEMVPR